MDDWRNEAACLDRPADKTAEQWANVFYPRLRTVTRRKINVTDAYAQALAVCRRCPVADACLADAMATEGRWERSGMRGGLDPDERQLLADIQHERRAS